MLELSTIGDEMEGPRVGLAGRQDVIRPQSCAYDMNVMPSCRQSAGRPHGHLDVAGYIILPVRWNRYAGGKYSYPQLLRNLSAQEVAPAAESRKQQ